MNQPLGRTVGNALEVIEAFEALRGDGPEDFITLCRELSAEMLVLGSSADTVDEGRAKYDELIASGAALEKMREIITAQAGEPRVLDDYSLLPTARHERKVPAKRNGYVQAIDTEAIGRASMLLGAGRLRLDSKIDLSVGITVEARIGDRVDESTPLALMHFNDAVLVDEAGAVIMQAYRIGAERTQPPALIKDVLR
jgi:thymidine phosphorylase